VLEEAEFYNVADLVALVKQHIADRDAKRNQVNTVSVTLAVTLVVTRGWALNSSK